jgi:hypothetical protein
MTLTAVKTSTKKRGIMNSATDTFVETADAIAETAGVFRKSMQTVSRVLDSLESEIYVDSLQELVNKGLTAKDAAKLIEDIKARTI